MLKQKKYTNLSLKSKIYYDAISEGYNSLYGDEQRVKYSELSEWLSLLQGSVLDVGSGTGIINEFIKPTVLLDYSFSMLNQATGVRVCADANFLPFKSKCFDNITCFTVLQDVYDKKRVLGELRRVCKDYVIITVLKRLRSKKELESLFTGFDVVDYLENDKDHCFLLKVKEQVKDKKLRIPKF